MNGWCCHVGSLKLAMVGIFTPWKWVNVPDSLSFLEEPVDKHLPALLCWLLASLSVLISSILLRENRGQGNVGKWPKVTELTKNRAGRSVLLVDYSLNYIFVPWIPWMCSLSLWSYPVTTPQPERASSSSSTNVRWEWGCHQVSGKPAGASQRLSKSQSFLTRLLYMLSSLVCVVFSKDAKQDNLSLALW